MADKKDRRGREIVVVGAWLAQMARSQATQSGNHILGKLHPSIFVHNSCYDAFNRIGRPTSSIYKISSNS